VTTTVTTSQSGWTYDSGSSSWRPPSPAPPSAHYHSVTDIVNGLLTPGVSVPAANVQPGTLTGPFSVTPGLELYNPTSTPYIDFHRAANAAGDSNADYNVRLINNAANQLELDGGKFVIGTAAGTEVESLEIHNTTGGKISGISIHERTTDANRCVIYADNGAGRLWYNGDRLTWDGTRIHIPNQMNGPFAPPTPTTFAELTLGANVRFINGLTNNGIIMAFTQVVSISGGNSNITFPETFPNGLICVVVSNGDGPTGIIFNTTNYGSGSIVGCGLQAQDYNGGLVTGTYRVNCVAVGW
jgi:hypothetical protein